MLSNRRSLRAFAAQPYPDPCASGPAPFLHVRDTSPIPEFHEGGDRGVGALPWT